MYKNILIIVWIMFIFGCGDNSSNSKNVLGNNHSRTLENSNQDNSNNNTKKEVGYLIDSPIVNMPYSCGGESNETSTGGKFECSSLPVTFEIGHLKIATVNKVPDDKKLYIQDIVGVDRDNIKDKRVLKLALLIQSLDDDGDISKAIHIKVRELNTPKKSIEDLDIDDVKEILNNSKEIKHIVTEDEAIKHLQNNLSIREDNNSVLDTSDNRENNNHTTTPENYNFQLNNNHTNQDTNNSSQTNSDENNITSDDNSTSNNNHTNQDTNNSSQTDSGDNNVTSDDNSTSNNNHTNQDTNNSSQTDSDENNVTSDNNSTSNNNHTNQDTNNSSQTDSGDNNVTSDDNSTENNNSQIDTINAIYISPNGDDDNNGSFDTPIKDTKKICHTGTVLDNRTIYFKDGVYNNFPIIKCSGTASHPLEIKPLNSEKVKFTFDGATGVRVDGDYIKLSGIEIEGVAQQIKYKDALANWWNGDRYYNGSGLVVTGHHIEISDCVVHDTSGSGISARLGDYINIHDNIVYNADWWTIAGSKGIGVTDAVATDNNGYIKIENNLIFNVESRIYSRVWGKGFAHLDLDEGEAILVQINDSNYTGRYSIKNNFLLFDGKGIVVNKTNRADVVNNTLYHTGTTISGKFRGIRASLTTDSNISNNSVEIFGNGHSFNIGKSDTSEVTLNSNCGNGEESLDGVDTKNSVFPNANRLDFTPVSGCNGADLAVWNSLKTKADRLGIEIKPTNWIPNYQELTQGVIEHIPDNTTIDWSSWSDSKPFDLNITDIPSGVKGRPDKFRLEVVYPYARIDIAHKFGIATQGTKEDYQYYEPAYYAIDNNDSTYNHTRGGANGENWLQIELPNPTKVQKVVIQNRDSHANRIEGAKVYLSDTPYSGEVNETKLIGTLQKTNDEQIITLNPIKSGTYLLIKGEQSSNDNKHIHLRKVEIYGTVPNTPLFEEAETNLLIPNSTAIGTKVATASAIDYQDDTLSYTILSDVPFSVDSNGDIAVDGELSNPSYTFDVEVSDGVNSTVKTITINVTSVNALEEALQSGEVDNITLSELLDGTLDKIESIKSYKDTLLRAIYQDNPVSYDPGRSSQNIVELVNNDKAVALLSGSKYTLALGGEENDTRYLIFGSIPYNFFANGKNLSYKPFLNRELLWLIGGLPINSDLNSSVKTIAYFSVSNEDNLKSYINSEFPKWNLKKCSDYSALNSCVDGSDLIIFEQKDSSKSQEIKDTLDFAISKHIPLAYFHPDWGKNDIAMTVAKRFNFTFPHGGNFWAQNKTDVDEYTLMVKNSELDQIKTVITHFENNDYSFDWNKCKNSHGNYGSEHDDCSEVEGLKEEFINGATEVQKRLKNVDSKKIDLFKKEKFEFLKLLALVGDKIRQNVKYPMDKTTTDNNEFMKSLYSDYSIYNYREINPVQPDMGNFSRSDFSSITPITKTISMVSKTPLRAGGVYVLPGKTVRVTRLDNNSSVHSYIFVNTLRSGATHEYGKNSGYRRPKFLHSQKIEVKPNESIYFTSPYGGPLQIAFDQNGADVSFRVENVGQHPVWSEFDSNPNKDKDFADALDANEYDWAEIITSAFEVHSKRDLMLESINNFRWGSASKLADATKTYASSHPMALAGFKGPGIETINEIKDYSELKNIPIYNADFVKHMNADQAACGSGCSGNPYDAYWSFDPISHGDIHEVGHSLEKGIFRLKGWEGHSTTNIYAYYTQMKYNMYVHDNSLADNYYIENWHVSVDVFKAQYSALQNCADSNDTISCMKSYWDSSNYAGQSLFTIQAMYQAQKYASGDYTLSNGFHLVGRLHLLERYLDKDAKKDWENNKDKLGFSSYSLDEIKKIPSNDWLLISLSWATGIDYRPFFDMYGASYSQKASDQVENFGFSTTTKKEFFVVEKDGGFTLPYDNAGAYLNKKSVPVDGNTTYPY